MQSNTVTLVCTLLPKPGKLERLKEVLINLARKAHANEKGNLKYVVWEQQSPADGNNAGSITLFEEWASQADLDKHHTQDYLDQTHKTLEDEDLLMQPEEIKRVTEVEGFWNR